MRCLLAVLLFLPLTFFAQEYQVKGTIYDKETGLEVPFATIQVEGKMVGTISDLYGNFSLTDSVPIQRIEVRLAGYQTLLVDLVSDIGAPLKSIVLDLELIPHGAHREVYKPTLRLPHSSQVLATSQRAPGFQSTHFPAENGVLSGVQATPLSGDPAAALSLRIRGHNHITNSNEPLYIIDGMEVMPLTTGLLGAQYGTPAFRDPLRFLPPSQIQELSIMRGPETAQFGQRGANGVVKVTTHRASGKPFVYFNQKLSLSYVPTWPKRLDKASYEDWALNSGTVPDELLQNNEQDWLARLGRMALGSEQHLALGGKYLTKIPYRLGINIHNRQGPVNQTAFNRLHLHFTTTYKRGSFEIPISYAASLDGGSLLPHTASAMPRADLLLSALSMNPSLSDQAEPNLFFPNPLRIQREVQFANRSLHQVLSLQPKFSWGSQNYLAATLRFLGNQENILFNSPFAVNSSPFSHGKIHTQVRNRQLQSRLMYYKAIDGFHHRFFGRISWRSQFQWRNIINGNLSFLPPFAVGPPQATPSYASFTTFPALSLRAYHAPELFFRYFYRKGIDFTAGVRAERLQNALQFSYRVPTTWQLYPHAALGIDIMGWLKTKSDFRSYLRFAYGEPGWGASRTQAYNIAWDFAHNIDKPWLTAYFKGSLAIYRKQTHEMRYAEGSNGLGNPAWQPKAVGTIQNEGIELRLNFQPQFRGRNIWAHTAVTLTIQQNKLIALADSSLQQLGNLQTPFMPLQPIRQLTAGQSVGSFFLPSFQGVDNNGTALMGKSRYVGQGLARLFGGLHQRIGYKKWLFSVMLEGAAGFEILNDMATAFGRQGGLYAGSNFFPSALENDLPPYYEQPFASDYIVERGDYLRLSHVNLQYTLEWLKKDEAYAKNRIDFTLSVQNAWLWTKYSGNDPALALGSLWGAGQDYINYPLGRVWTLGIAFWK